MSGRKFAFVGDNTCGKFIEGLLVDLAEVMSPYKLLLRSGGGICTETIFENAYLGEKEIFLPFLGYNGNKSHLTVNSFKNIAEANVLTSATYPCWGSISTRTQTLAIRYSYVMLGRDLADPVDFLVAYIGNTNVCFHALTIAQLYNKPVFNLGNSRIYSTKSQKLKFVDDVITHIENFSKQGELVSSRNGENIQ